MGKKINKSNLTLNHIEALNAKQKRCLSSKKHLILMGSAGTGKTFLASYMGFDSVQRGFQDRVMFIRSAVPTRDIGFLPGTEREKMEVYTKPYIDTCNQLFSCGTAYYSLEREGKILFEPTSFVRGRNLRNSFIIVDECQNMTFHELDSIITRLDDDSRIVFCGDTNQADLSNNGFGQFYSLISKLEEFEAVKFTTDDVVRSGLVKKYLQAKEKHFGK